MSAVFQEILSRTRAAVERYDMLPAGTRLAVGISGGKDSLVLLLAMAQLRHILHDRFELAAITLDPCFGGKETDFGAVQALCARENIPYTVKRTQLAEVIFEQRQEKNPCSLCAKMRRGILHRTAAELGCNTLALGHHKQDAAETFLMNLLSGGTLSCFSPKTYLDRSGITLVRPLVLVDEHDIRRAAAQLALPVVASRCPVDGCTNRKAAGELLTALSATYGALDEKIIGAIQKAHLSGW